MPAARHAPDAGRGVPLRQPRCVGLDQPVQPSLIPATTRLDRTYESVQGSHAAAQKASAAQADTAAMAKIYQDNPAYANQQAVLAQASAWKATDKVIVPAGTNPTIVLGNGTGQQTVVQTPSR
jgi:hypothetical protein